VFVCSYIPFIQKYTHMYNRNNHYHSLRDEVAYMWAYFYINKICKTCKTCKYGRNNHYPSSQRRSGINVCVFLYKWYIQRCKDTNTDGTMISILSAADGVVCVFLYKWYMHTHKHEGKGLFFYICVRISM